MFKTFLALKKRLTFSKNKSSSVLYHYIEQINPSLTGRGNLNLLLLIAGAVVGALLFLYLLFGSDVWCLPANPPLPVIELGDRFVIEVDSSWWCWSSSSRLKINSSSSGEDTKSQSIIELSPTFVAFYFYPYSSCSAPSDSWCSAVASCAFSGAPPPWPFPWSTPAPTRTRASPRQISGH